MDKETSELIEKIEGKLIGGGRVMVCCHPDVDDMPIYHGDRTCVLDTLEGAKGCDIATSEKLRAKEDCPYWQGRMSVSPVPPTIEEGLALIAALKARLHTEGQG